ncbi:unnamed protein product [Rhizoctonia solani]|uniref:Uncharacterized protein n=1 Tax=Rhizoctonia solani TaxID=456999 RepID=A0A8H3E2C3_9AGAM|nr:unnamed protein product [Rhizoctonia solani]
MSSKLALLVGVSLAATTVFGQGSSGAQSSPSAAPAPTTTRRPSTFTPLASKHFEYTALPYQADTDTTGERGAQSGYNLCNSTTEGPTSRCQTAMINSIDDFCLWGPPEPNSSIGNTEGEAVAWCTKPGRGTRVIPAGSITGVQFMKTKSYVQVTGHIKQVNINIAANDNGGEMDPHGADRRGNPLGGLLFTNAFPSNGGNNGTYQQVIEWHNFMGADRFCLKACDPADPDDDKYCEHILDRIGCEYNAPAAYRDGVFESCEGENQDFPGVYTNAAGQVTTYKQPPESAGDIKSMPYQPKIPASSNCVTFQSAALYTGTVGGADATAGASGTRSAATAVTPGATGSTSSSNNAAAGSFAPFGVLVTGSIFFFRHELLKQYDYYWRIEPDVTFFCDLNDDPFLFMQDSKKVYGFTIALYEFPETIWTLWNATREFIQTYPEYVPEDNAMAFLSDDGGQTYNNCHFWSNFEIGDLNFWRSEAYTKYFDFLDSKGGFYYEVRIQSSHPELESYTRLVAALG